MTDSHDLIVDHTGDGGDSCNFTCFEIFLRQQKEPSLIDSRVELFFQNGHPVRHPFQEPWNNPRNFSRDQAIPLLAVLSPVQVRDFYHKTVSRKFFLPNRERDEVGSRKYPFPHVFRNDHNRLEFRVFDFADPVTPDLLGVMIERGHLEHLHWLRPLTRRFCRWSIRAHVWQARNPTFNDFKQLYITAKILGLHRELIEKHPRGLEQASEIYFTKRRKLIDLHELFLEELERERVKIRTTDEV